MRNGDLFRAALCILLLALESPAFTPSSNDMKKTKERVSSLKVEQRDDLQSGYNTDQPYSSFLYSAKRKSRNKKRTEKLQRLLENENDDGYKTMMKKESALWKRWLLVPLKFAYSGTKMIIGARKNPGTLILVR
jgi:hypothetical protein